MGGGWLERAQALDAAGEHDEAINELSRGTRAQDAAATRALGFRLLLGDRAPLLPEAGLRFLGEACDAGVPEAAARAAGILALGVRSPPDWGTALVWLARSAHGGWPSAQRQILALCDDRALAARVGALVKPDAADWQAVARAVRLDDWHRAPPATIRSAEPRVNTFPGLVRSEICDVLVSFATGRLEPARVYDPAGGNDIIAPHRNNTVATFGLHEVELVHSLLQARMSAASGLPERWMESPTVLHYHPGEQIREHYDFVDPASTDDYAAEIARNGQRVATFIVYLNEDYDGGETEFPKLGISHKGRCGEGILFTNSLADRSPDRRMIHAGRPTTRGEKWIVTQFIRDRPMR
jgi:prolyl 4-hydroxylase